MLYKTQICQFFEKGLCQRGEQCCWAHGEADLRPVPSFYKTRMCYNWQHFRSCSRENCGYAHSREEIRGSGKALRLCNSFCRLGSCAKGSRCPMAHDIRELDASVREKGEQLLRRTLQDPDYAICGDNDPLAELNLAGSDSQRKLAHEFTQRNYSPVSTYSNAQFPNMENHERQHISQKHPELQHMASISDFRQKYGDIEPLNPQSNVQPRNNRNELRYSKSAHVFSMQQSSSSSSLSTSASFTETELIRLLNNLLDNHAP